jgi:hypothetical protein
MVVGWVVALVYCIAYGRRFEYNFDRNIYQLSVSSFRKTLLWMAVQYVVNKSYNHLLSAGGILHHDNVLYFAIELLHTILYG